MLASLKLFLAANKLDHRLGEPQIANIWKS